MKKINKLNCTMITVILLMIFCMATPAFAAPPSLVPTQTVEPTIETDEVTVKKYDIETLAKAVSRCRHLTVDSNNNVYFIDFYNDVSNKLITIVNGVKKIIADGGNNKYRALDLTNLVFDKSSNRVLLLCNFNSEYYYEAEFEGTSVVYDIKDLTTPIAIFQQGYFTSDDQPIMDGNTIIDNGLMFDLDTLETTLYTGGFNSTYAAFINNEYISYGRMGFSKYDLATDNEMKIPVTFTDIKSINAISSFNNKFYLYSLSSRSFYEIDMAAKNPKTTLFISNVDIVIKDRFPFGNISEFTFYNDGSIVFYDPINKAIRRITQQPIVETGENITNETETKQPILDISNKDVTDDNEGTKSEQPIIDTSDENVTEERGGNENE